MKRSPVGKVTGTELFKNQTYSRAWEMMDVG